MAGAEPEETVNPGVVQQSWCDITFLHWAYEPEVVAEHLPDGLQPDVRDGAAWIGLTPFSVERVRVPPFPPLPYLSCFPETNVRTYARGPNGVDGIWFMTLEVDSLATTVAARMGYGVPYRWARMRVDRRDDRISYSSRRRGGGQPAGHEITVQPGTSFGPGELSELDHWLTGRWRGWTRVAGRLAEVPLQHQPWPLQRASVVELEETLFADLGLPPPDDPPLVHFSPGVDARLGPPRFSARRDREDHSPGRP
jgi:uncharacterized protein